MRRESSGLRWACATIAPWCLASGLLMSFTAAADTDAGGGGSRAVREANRTGKSYFVAGPGTTDLAMLLGPDIAVNRLSAPWVQPPSSLSAEDGVTGSAPRGELKRNAAEFPSVERMTKGDPLIQLRPAFGRRPLRDRDRDLAAASFGAPEPKRDVERATFTPGDLWTNRIVGTASFTGWQIQDGATAPAPRGAFTSAADIISATTRAKLTAGNPDGATPSTPRAVRLSSSTPVPPDSTPIEIAAVPVSFSELVALNSRQLAKGNGLTTARKEEGEKPNYAELVAPDRMGREERCLAEAVYFEARSEPETGQAAVAQVVLNRVKSGLYPTSICGVVYQNRNRYLGCQFSFACEGKSLRVTEPDAWARAARIATNVLKGDTYLANVGAALNYHANYVRPYWARSLQRTSIIGHHIFYKPKDTDG
ncbi:Cell wall hydrolase CwlJ, involved in spore germination [Rhizobiales bacterium GAS191]|nr:Cell wall hydrolase CwlJ, involved in spore germination [Rhizobiales bacterium GAS113]SED53916.1 Cell wall hydrolase CwlJ, involved in spore germination [Rhizobiales bacterium GAS191]